MTLSGRFERFIEIQRKSLSVISVKLIPLPSQACDTRLCTLLVSFVSGCLEPVLLAVGLLGTNCDQHSS
jgi:hypothetical protein